VSVFGIAGSGTYTSWTINIGGAKTVDGTLPIAQGGTGATTAANARTNLALGAADSPSFAGMNVTGNLTVDTTTLFVDAASNRVGIGTSSPSQPLQVVTSGATAAGISATNTTGNANIFTSTSNTGTGTLFFGDTDNFQSGFIQYSHTSDAFNVRSAGHIRLQTGGATERMRIDSTGNVGIGTSSPSEKLDVTGNVTISGSLSKGSGSFKIDHPVKPDTHHLVHSFIEGPQADNLYRGKVTLIDGKATVNLDEAGRMTEGTFVALNGNVQCFTTNEDGWTQIRGKVKGNILTIEAQDTACTDEVSWLVIGERHDQHMLDTSWTDAEGRIITEPEKVINIQPETEND
jgi:hypothetical protein